MIYFAYGSNMLTYRLEKRVGKAEILGIGKLQQHKLEFNKKSADDSLKADAFFTGNASDEIIGIIFKINPNKKADLDKAEGLGKGYELKNVKINYLDSKQTTEAFTYVATDIDQSGTNFPYDWYVEIIMAGAEEHGLSEKYKAEIKSVKTKPDPNENRSYLSLTIIKESKALRKTISDSMDLMSELNKAKECKVLLLEHPFHERKIVVEKIDNGFKFQTDSIIQKGRQTHKEISVTGKQLILEEEKRKWVIDGKNFLVNNIDYDFDNTLKIVGGTINSIASTSTKEFNEKHLRLIIPINNKLRIINDYRSKGFVIEYKLRGGLMSIEINKKEFHFFDVKWGDKDYLIIDCTSKSLFHEFQLCCNAILLSYAFLSGVYNTGEGYYFAFPDEKHETPDDVLFHSLSNPIDNLFGAFTTNPFIGIDTETLKRDEQGMIIEEARKELYKDLDFFPAEVYSKLCQFAFEDDKVLRTLILLVYNHSSTLEMKIPVQFVAIETITAALVKGGNSELKPIDDDKIANNLIDKLKKEAEIFLKEKKIELDSNEKIQPLLKRLNNLNTPTNTDKLSKPFSGLGYELSEDEKKALKMRDKFLHGSTLAFGEVEDEFKELFYISLRLHFLIAVLLLKKSGYTGRIINYAKMYEYITEKYLAEDVLKKI